jgi:DUF438 domain-containing protein
MDEHVLKHLKEMYGLNSDIPHLAFQFPRLPPGIIHPMQKIHENPLREKFIQNTSMINKKLDSFQKLYQQHVSGLMTMNANRVIPPGHPLYSEKNSIEYLKAENDKLVKQNLQLKKKLEKANN